MEITKEVLDKLMSQTTEYELAAIKQQSFAQGAQAMLNELKLTLEKEEESPPKEEA